MDPNKNVTTGMKKRKAEHSTEMGKTGNSLTIRKAELKKVKVPTEKQLPPINIVGFKNYDSLRELQK